MALCQSGASQSGLPRIRTQDQGLFGCLPGTICASSPNGTRRATVWVKVPSSNHGDVTHKGQINKWPHKTLCCPAHSSCDAPVRLGTRAKKADIYVGTSFVLYSGRAAEDIWLCASQGLHRVASPGFEIKTKVFLVALLVPSALDDVPTGRLIILQNKDH